MNRRHRVWKGDLNFTAAPLKGVRTDSRHTTVRGNHAVIKARDQSVTFRFDQAVADRVKVGVAHIYSQPVQASAMRERRTDAHDRRRTRHGGNTSRAL